MEVTDVVAAHQCPWTSGSFLISCKDQCLVQLLVKYIIVCFPPGFAVLLTVVILLDALVLSLSEEACSGGKVMSVYSLH